MGDVSPIEQIRIEALKIAAIRLSGNDFYRQQRRDTISAETVALAKVFERYLIGER